MFLDSAERSMNSKEGSLCKRLRLNNNAFGELLVGNRLF